MKFNCNADTLKYAGGALVILAAVCIMLPDLLGYLSRLWRLGLFIVAIIAMAWTAALVVTKIKMAKLSLQSKTGDDAHQPYEKLP